MRIQPCLPMLMSAVIGLAGLALFAGCSAQGANSRPVAGPRAMVGAYYFDGWAGKSEHAGKEAWAKDAPKMLTKRMLDEFPQREPIWGWRDDTQEIMERQIDLAADNGIGFFSFCWYWRATPKEIAEDPLNTSLNLFVKARNKDRMKYCLLVANHEGFFIGNTENWRQAARLWIPYFKDKQYVTVDGKPLVIIFNPSDASAEGLAALQDEARKAGLPGVAVAASGEGDPKMGFGWRTHYNIIWGSRRDAQKHPYKELVDLVPQNNIWAGSPQQPYIPTVTAGWDKRPWEGPQGLGQPAGRYFPDRTPEAVAGFVDDAITWMDKHPDQTTKERLVLIYAWNEFGEGGYIAPTKGDPDGKYLKAIKAVVSRKE